MPPPPSAAGCKTMSSCTSRTWLCQEQGPQQSHTPPTGSDRDRGFEVDGSLPPSFPPQGVGGMGTTTAMTSNGLVQDFTVTRGENVIVCYPAIKTQNKSHGQRIASCLSDLMKRENKLEY